MPFATKASAREAAEAAPAMTPEEALAAAEQEGLMLVRSNTNTTGFKHVVWHKSNTTRPYALRVRQDGRAQRRAKPGDRTPPPPPLMEPIATDEPPLRCPVRRPVTPRPVCDARGSGTRVRPSLR